jgi:hypothetical protein
VTRAEVASPLIVAIAVDAGAKKSRVSNAPKMKIVSGSIGFSNGTVLSARNGRSPN